MKHSRYLCIGPGGRKCNCCFPYTNPNAHIYYSCQCGAILDPGTKSFAALNNAAMNAGWKVRRGALSYVPYCVECGKDVE